MNVSRSSQAYFYRLRTHIMLRAQPPSPPSLREGGNMGEKWDYSRFAPAIPFFAIIISAFSMRQIA